jgi:hypothetical protein
MKNLPSTFKNRASIRTTIRGLAILCILTLLQFAGRQAQAAITLPPALADLLIGLAGEFLYDGATWYFNEAPDRTDSITTNPELITINNRKQYRTYYQNELSTEGTQSTSTDARYEKFKYLAVYLTWDEMEEEFIYGGSIENFGLNFVDLAPLMKANTAATSEESGYYLYWGETEKSNADHFIRSTASGSGNTLPLSRAASDRKYTAITDVVLSDVSFDESGNWRSVRRNHLKVRPTVLSAVMNQNKDLAVLESNTQLEQSIVHGWSKVFWDKTTRKATYFRQSPTDFFIPYEGCNDDCCSSDRNPNCYNNGPKKPVTEPVPVQVSYKDWKVDQQTGH